jgi:hypothetical protein
MFGWFKPSCPVEPAQRTWIAGRMRWLIGEFGLDRARTSAVILPTSDFFPDAYDGSESAGRVLFERVCGYMGINPSGLEMGFYEGQRPVLEGGWQSHSGAAGLYEGSSWGTMIHLDAASLADPLLLVATAAHELAHVLLLGQGRLYGDEPDHEQLTDLLTIYLGLGVFTANTRVRDRAGHDGTHEHWSIQRLGYLDQREVGYALAVWSRLREESSPAWVCHLCGDVRSYFKQASRWLAKNPDRVLDPETGSPVQLSDDELPPGFGPSR